MARSWRASALRRRCSRLRLVANCCVPRGSLKLDAARETGGSVSALGMCARRLFFYHGPNLDFLRACAQQEVMPEKYTAHFSVAGDLPEIAPVSSVICGNTITSQVPVQRIFTLPFRTAVVFKAAAARGSVCLSMYVFRRV